MIGRDHTGSIPMLDKGDSCEGAPLTSRQCCSGKRSVGIETLPNRSTVHYRTHIAEVEQCGDLPANVWVRNVVAGVNSIESPVRTENIAPEWEYNLRNLRWVDPRALNSPELTEGEGRIDHAASAMLAPVRKIDARNGKMSVRAWPARTGYRSTLRDS